LEKIRVERQIGNATFSIETGILAKQAAGACLVQYGDTVVLVASAGGPSRPGTDFFPLTCDYRERTAAAGKFPGGFMKREGRPTTKETLTARLMDRPIRPMFPEGYNDEVQIQAEPIPDERQQDRDDRVDQEPADEDPIVVDPIELCPHGPQDRIERCKDRHRRVPAELEADIDVEDETRKDAHEEPEQG
jgi:hypothetical protein